MSAMSAEQMNWWRRYGLEPETAAEPPSATVSNTGLQDIEAYCRVLNYQHGERVSFNHQTHPGGRFTSRIIDVGDLPAAVVNAPAQACCWIGVNPTTATRGRGTAATVSRLVSMYCELDDKNTTPEQQAAIIADLAALFGPPSMIVGSGHGKHLYWPIADGAITDDFTTDAAAKLLNRFGRIVTEVAAKHGAGKPDPIWDIARVLRAPGTTNYKDVNHPVPVTLTVNESAQPLTVADAETRLDAADELYPPPAPPRANAEIPHYDMRIPTTYTGESVIDKCNTEHSWRDVLPDGWTCLDADPDADGARWLHPTATSDCSATIRGGSLYVWTPNTPFDQSFPGSPRGYDKFDVYALLHHGGDKSAAAKALRPPTDYGHTDFGAAPSAVTSAAEAPARRPQVRAAETLKPAAAPRWLAQKRIPRGQVTVLVGDEGIGKSLFWVWIVAYVTTGRALPEFGIPARTPGVVLLIITEDAWDTDVRARLEAAGANLDNVRVLCEDEDGNGAPVFPRDFDLIRDYGEPLSLIVVDAWLDTVSAGLKVSDTQQARQALDPWKTTAARTDAAVLLLAHTNRIASGSARDRIGATAALRQKARMLLLAQLDEDDNLTVGPEKANGVRIVDAAAFTIAGVQRFTPTDDHDGTVPLLTYAGDSDRTARQIHEDMHAAAKNQRGNSEPDDEVSLWLRGTIEAAAPCWAAPAYEEAEMRGWSADKVKRAKKKLGAAARKDADTGHWYWTLPRQGSAEGGKGAPHRVHPAPLPSSQVSEGSAPPSKPTPSDLQGSEGSEGRRYIEFERPEVRREASSGTTPSPSSVEQHGQQTWGGAA